MNLEAIELLNLQASEAHRARIDLAIGTPNPLPCPNCRERAMTPWRRVIDGAITGNDLSSSCRNCQATEQKAVNQ
jgi:hypothetical protein